MKLKISLPRSGFERVADVRRRSPALKFLEQIRLLTLAATAIAVFANVAQSEPGESPPLESKSYLTAVRRFADTALEHGRDKYGKQHTPLFVDGLHVETLEPVRWKRGGETWVLCNFASQQALMRTLDGLTGLTKDKRYRQSAEDATRYALTHLTSPSGLIYWGGHLAWDLDGERVVGQYADVHEFKRHQPHFPLLWRVDAEATRRLLEAIWATHVVDWSRLDYNRHAKTEIMVKPPWDHSFEENIEVPFLTDKQNLSFALVTPSLLAAGTSLAVLGNDESALLWTRRLAYRWQQCCDPKTGLSGGQLSYHERDRARDALGHVHPDINEAKIVATYHRKGRYQDIPLAEMQAAEQLIAAGGARAKVGNEFIRWASEDLKTYGKYCYDAASGNFISMMTDGTPIKWQESRKGYYTPESFEPAVPDGMILWNYALAYRLTRDEAHWNMVRSLAKSLQLGDIGRPKSKERELGFTSAAANWQYIYALLELAKATGDRSFLKLASRVGDNLLQTQTSTGLFPREGRLYARTGDEVPLALLHLAAALDGKSSRLPPPMLDNGYLHAEYDGSDGLNPNIKDKRTYDRFVFYGDR